MTKQPKGTCSCCEREFDEVELGGFGEDCVLCEDCFTNAIPRLRQRIKELETPTTLAFEALVENNVRLTGKNADLTKRVTNALKWCKRANSKDGAGVDELIEILSGGD